MAFVIEVATKQETYARVEMAGPSGSGKTYSAILIARGLVGPTGKIGVICTENKSARKYSDVTRFFVGDLRPPYSPAAYIEAIRAFAKMGVDCLVVDSLSHAWAGPGGVLERVDEFTAASKSKNSFSEGWGKGTKEQNALIDALVSFPGHLIVCLRVKTAYEIVDNGRGGREPIRLGMAPVQRDGVEYEFDVCIDLHNTHGTVWKTRCSTLYGAVIPKPGVALGETIRAWLRDGVVAIPPPGTKIHVDSGLVGFGPYRGLPRERLTDAELAESMQIGEEKIAGAEPTAVWVADARAHLEALVAERDRRAAQGITVTPDAPPAPVTITPPADTGTGVHDAKRRRAPPQRRPKAAAQPEQPPAPAPQATGTA